MKAQVLIVGAGPTGLALAHSLVKLGVPFRIIDQNKGPGEASRALVIHARILEHYAQLGLAEQIVERGLPMSSLRFWEGKEEKAKLEFPNLGKGVSPFPYVLNLPQDEHEEILVKELQRAGVEVEWETSLSAFTDHGDRIDARLEKKGEEERTSVSYLVGCDGAHSTVRKGLGLGFPGGTYEQLFFVADVEADIAVVPGSMNIFVEDNKLLLFMPVREKGAYRVIGMAPPELTGVEDLSYADVSGYVEEKVGITATNVHWFSTYRVHHRVSEQFRKGRAFIAGDAGHIHSPAGGQGMNTGIGDAVNLSWKLAAVLKGEGDDALLDTYETERIAFARKLIATTDKVFQNVVGDNRRGSFLRNVFFPHMLPLLFGFSGIKKKAFRIVSQTEINYKQSSISQGTAGKIEAGDRLPWIETAAGDNFAPLASFDWQIHIYGEAEPALSAFAEKHALPIHAFPWQAGMEKKGWKQDALYLIRPDGYVALALPEQEVAAFNSYLKKHNILFDKSNRTTRR
ncbi:UNVERIFIED_CONTAM: FAD-dependent monooxygenase [Halobacillus marinus]